MATPAGQIVLHGVHKSKVTGEVVELATYPIDIPALADNETGSLSFNIVSDMDFLHQETTHSFKGIAADSPVNVKVNFSVTNGRPWFMGKPVYVGAISSGNPGMPRRPLLQRLIMAQTTITVEYKEAG